jgi:hypothetical protein
MRFALAWIAVLFLLQSLPDSNTFISEFRKTLRSDDELLQNYSYTEKETRTENDRSDNPKSTEVNIYQVFPDRGQLYRRLISKNGIPLTQTELDKEDRDQEIKKPAGPRDDSKIRDELFEIYEIQVERRESLEGSPAVVLSFRPRPGYKPQSKLTSFLTHVSGRVWVNEADHQLVRVEAEVFDPVSYGWFLGSLQEGTRLIAERRKVHDGHWLPAKLDIQKSQRVLLKGLHLHEVHEYSEHRKF